MSRLGACARISLLLGVFRWQGSLGCLGVWAEHSSSCQVRQSGEQWRVGSSWVSRRNKVVGARCVRVASSCSNVVSSSLSSRSIVRKATCQHHALYLLSALGCLANGQGLFRLQGSRHLGVWAFGRRASQCCRCGSGTVAAPCGRLRRSKMHQSSSNRRRRPSSCLHSLLACKLLVFLTVEAMRLHSTCCNLLAQPAVRIDMLLSTSLSAHVLAFASQFISTYFCTLLRLVAFAPHPIIFCAW